MTLPALPPIPRMPRTATLPSADLVPTTDQIAPPRGEATDDLGPAPDGLDTDVLHYPKIADLSKSLARAVAEFEPGLADRLSSYVRTTARAGLLLIMILVTACGQGPVQVGPDPGQAQPVIVPATPAPVPAAAPPKTPAPPSRLKLPRAWVEVDGVKIPVGPLHDQDTGKDCTLQVLPTGDALCVPVETVRIQPSDVAYIDIDCTTPAAKIGTAAEAWDGARVWRYLAGSPPIPSGTAASAQRDPVTGQCRPARVIMAGGDWAFSSPPVPATLIFALLRQALD